MKYPWFYFFYLFLTLNLSGQTINMKFPYLAGEEYSFRLLLGEKEDTICKGKIPPDGQFTIVIPEKYKNHKGMAKWYLKKGGGLALVISNENFSVECLDSLPLSQNIHYFSSKENNFLYTNFYKQKEITNQYEAVSATMHLYSQDDSFYSILESEKARLLRGFNELRQELDSSTLYAAEFRKISDFVSDIGKNMNVSEKEYIRDFDQYVVHEINWEYLYTSGHWRNIITKWIRFHIQDIQDQDLFFANTRIIVSKIKNKSELYYSFSAIFIDYLTREQREDLLKALS